MKIYSTSCWLRIIRYYGELQSWPTKLAGLAVTLLFVLVGVLVMTCPQHLQIF